MRPTPEHVTTTPSSAPAALVRRRRAVPLAAAAVTVLALTAVGCGTGGTGTTSSGTPSGPVTTTTAVSPPADPAPSATSQPPSGTAPATTAPTTAPAPPRATATSATRGAQPASTRCTVTDLRMRLGRGDPGAGNTYYPLDFTNTGKTACTLAGFPGVSLIRRDGSAIGKPAARRGPAGPAVRIAAGQTVEADLHTLNKGIQGDSCWGKPTYLMVYPPGSTESMTLATSSPLVCGDTFDVSAVH
ncbi:DUF4232 domain-containing protein [Streptomyces polygonati]|uniref:DUF4232 domain-containing protein n=1 Tax=Streptomyces polygonati TaxID=1617087 RepID=A0ABV8HGW4_9ACTN